MNIFGYYKKNGNICNIKITNQKHKIMKQNIYFRNGEDLKKKVCELIDRYADFTVVGNCIEIEKPDNVKITCKIKNEMKTKGIYIDGLLMQDIVEKIYRTVNIEELFGEPGRIMKVEILE